jgi:hypothetical protein
LIWQTGKGFIETAKQATEEYKTRKEFMHLILFKKWIMPMPLLM